MNQENLKQIKQEIEALIGKIKQWNYEYYVLNQSSVSDAIYDQYYQKLVALEKKYPQFAKLDSPTKTVGSDLTNNQLRKIKHKIPMLSLANGFRDEDLIRFDQQVKKLTGINDIDYVCELKIDGLSIAVTYENNHLKLAATRGDGTLGEDITENARAIKSIPLVLQNCNLPTLEVRGEVYLSKSDFNLLNQQQKNLELPLFANPRNAASGTLRQLDINIVANRKLNAFLYYYMDAAKDGITTHEAALLALKKFGFNINPEWKLCHNITEVMAYIKKYEAVRENLPYEIDGIVIKVNDLALYSILGNTNKAPRWALAYKFPAATTTTQLLNIFPTVGRTGKITYNAQLKPVLLSGSTISFATLHNADYIINRDLQVNDIVEIKKAGDIIPEVIKPIITMRSKETIKFKIAIKCPQCNSDLEKVAGEVDQYCVNTNCSARILKSLIHFTSRNAMDIVGLSEKLLTRFLNLKWIKDVADIYNLVNYRQEILKLEKFGEKSFHNLSASILKSKTNSLERLLFALGIRHVGEKTAQVLAQQFKSLDNLMQVTEDDLAHINDIGPTIAMSVIDYFANSDNKSLIKKLASYKINFDYIAPDNDQPQIFANTTFVITGTLSQSRNYFISLLQNYGASVTSSVSAKTNYVLAGKDAGSKVIKANKLNVEIISEIELKKLIENKIK